MFKLMDHYTKGNKKNASQVLPSLDGCYELVHFKELEKLWDDMSDKETYSARKYFRDNYIETVRFNPFMEFWNNCLSCINDIIFDPINIDKLSFTLYYIETHHFANAYLFFFVESNIKNHKLAKKIIMKHFNQFQNLKAFV